MWNKCLNLMGFLALLLTGCNPELLIAKHDPGSYEVVALIAE